MDDMMGAIGWFMAIVELMAISYMLYRSTQKESE
jgi:hypothetical protein